MNDDAFLVSRDGEVWACWLNGQPAVNLGSEQNFWMVAEKLFNELHPEQQPKQEASALPSPEADRDSVIRNDKQTERNEPRFEVTVIGRMYGAGRSREVTIFDLSTRGCRVADRSQAKPGAPVTIKIGTLGPVGAFIRWRRDNFIGLKFEHPLHPAVLDNVRSQQSLR